MGLEIYEYDNNDTLHAKALLIDGRIGFIGTYNLDPRSSQINREIGFVIYPGKNDLSFAKKLHKQFQLFQKDPILVGKDRSEKNKDKEFNGVSFGKQILLKSLIYLMPVLRNQI